ncbi:hypothetical protein E3P77_03103 [Wallemia ichthyophaga]|nr:hypothetical protein E3P77_03103 [Wallemia ichthyophaga]
MEKHARRIHKVLRHCEDLSDRIVGRTGVLFVTFAVALLIPCTFSFFEVIFPHALAHSTPLTRRLAAVYCTWHAAVIFFNYYKAVTVSPGLVSVGEDEVAADTAHRSHTKCSKCSAVKPERAHHCRVCSRCILKYDHHCPWINQCVGLGNERYFVLFMLYLSAACLIVGVMGYGAVFDEVLPNRGSDEWTQRYYSPPFFAVLTWLLALLIGSVVGVMAAWQLSLVFQGLTSVEYEDHRAYRKAVRRDRRNGLQPAYTAINPYDFGWAKNLSLFFNIGGGRRHWTVLLLPIPHPPCGDGYTFAKRSTQGLQLHFDSESESEGDVV